MNQPPYPISGTPLIDGMGCAEVNLRNSYFVAESPVCRYMPPFNEREGISSIVIGNCVLDADTGVVVEITRNISLDVRNSLFRVKTHAFTVHRKPNAMHNSELSLDLTSNVVAVNGPVIAADDMSIVDRVRPTFYANAWLKPPPNIWSARIARPRGQTRDKIVTRSHQDFMDLFKTTEDLAWKRNIIPPRYERIEGLLEDPPARRGPKRHHVGPGKPYDTFRETNLYQRLLK